MHMLPQTLGNIYDELMQPLPEVLESILSPDRSGSESVMTRSMLSLDGEDDHNLTMDIISASQPVAQQSSDVLLDRSGRKSR